MHFDEKLHEQTLLKAYIFFPIEALSLPSSPSKLIYNPQSPTSILPIWGATLYQVYPLASMA